MKICSISLAFSVAASVIGVASLPVSGQQPTTPVSADNSSVTVAPVVPPTGSASNPTLRAVMEAVRGNDYTEAARLLHTLKVTSLEPNDARRWRAFASLVALRTGDRKWLDEVTSDPEHFANSTNLVTITAGRLLQDGRYTQARALLTTIESPDTLDEIPRRRYYELWARLEQLTGNPAAERRNVDKLVEFVSRWPSATCQGCHANPKRSGDEVTTLDVSHLWFGERYSTLLRQQGDAAAVRARAERILAAHPDDTTARLKLAFALRAQGDAVASEAALRLVPWVEFADRPKKPPLRLAVFP